jgi:hypothetical protein
VEWIGGIFLKTAMTIIVLFCFYICAIAITLLTSAIFLLKGGPSALILGDSLVRDAVDVHFVMKPICDFTEDGEPILCKIRKIRKRK